jgi:hypothetical protein
LDWVVGCCEAEVFVGTGVVLDWAVVGVGVGVRVGVRLGVGVEDGWLLVVGWEAAVGVRVGVGVRDGVGVGVATPPVTEIGSVRFSLLSVSISTRIYQ